MKTVRRPPYPKWNPGYFPCSSLTPPSAFLTPSIGVLRWIRVKVVPAPQVYCNCPGLQLSPPLGPHICAILAAEQVSASRAGSLIIRAFQLPDRRPLQPLLSHVPRGSFLLLLRLPSYLIPRTLYPKAPDGWSSTK